MKLYRNIDQHVQLCTRYFRLDLLSIFRVIALHLVSQKGFDIVIKPYGQVAQHILDLHLGFHLWIYPVFVDLFPLT
jgi:hypothetical protein